ncbi:TonB-dependent receptor [Marinilabiliaceae bacterium ANBcel2]|nr:TonB-dependent receptor [Marinilabiliaceae bacterium ANBcel2]
MLKKKFISFSLLILMAGYNTVAQNSITDISHQIKEVTVHSSRQKEYATGAITETPDSILHSAMRTSSLADLLSATGSASIKSYGAGGVTSLNIRGGGSSHTAVMWNGVNLQNPMNTGVNLAAIPLSFNNKIEIQHGGAGTLYGSGAVSGVIHINSENLFSRSNYTNVEAGYGSYNTKMGSISFKRGDENRASSFAFTAKTSDNDFKYKNSSRMDGRTETQSNAGFKQYGFTQNNQIKLTDNSTISTALWYQYNDKEVQTMMTSSRPNNQNQKDQNLNAIADYKYYGNNFRLNFKQAFLWNEVDYTDKEILSNSALNRSISSVTEFEATFNLSSGDRWSSGANYTHERGKSEAYRENGSRDRLSLFSFYQLNRIDDLTTVLSIRNEMSDSEIHPVVFAVGADYNITDIFSLNSNISRNYRIPSFNDIFWAEDAYSKGNPDLKPEYGWSGDGGVNLALNMSNTSLELSSTLFYSRTKDLIVWLQQGEKRLWTPTNKKTGHSKGYELRLKSSTKLNSSLLNIRASYYNTFSKLKTDDQWDNQQMIYVPRHRAATNITFRRENISAGFILNATGKRYYDYQNSLDSYIKGDLFIMKQLSMYDKNAQLNFRVNNIWDTEYQLTAFYAMPLRNYQLTLNINF